jgi:hypothetical protein
MRELSVATVTRTIKRKAQRARIDGFTLVVLVKSMEVI